MGSVENEGRMRDVPMQRSAERTANVCQIHKFLSVIIKNLYDQLITTDFLQRN